MASVVGYARLSTADQDKGLTLEQQVDRLKEAGAEVVLTDLMSGRSTERPRYKELLKRCAAGEISKVICTRWDRLTRGAAETCKLVDLFSADDAPELHLLDDPIDLSTIGGKLQLRILGAVAEAEVERTSERVGWGKAKRKAKGEIDVAPMGLKQVDGKLVVDRKPFLSLLSDKQERSKADLVLEMIDQLESSFSFQTPWRYLGEKYGLWAHRTMVQRLLLNPALRGAKVGGRCKNLAIATWADVEEGAGGEALIDPARHQRLEAIIRGQQARRSTPDKRRHHVLSGKVVCGHCGRKMGRTVVTRGSGRYSCMNEDCSWRIAGERRNAIPEHKLFTAVFQAFADQADELAALEEKQANHADEMVAERPEVLKLQAKRQNYLQLMADGDAPELQTVINGLDQQIAALVEAGTNWGELGMPKLAKLRQDASLRVGSLDLLDKARSGEIEFGQEIRINRPAPEDAVADWWREENGHIAELKWTDEQIQDTIYHPIPGELKDGGNYLNPNDYEWDPNPRIRLIRELVQEVRVTERQIESIKLNV